MSTETDEIDDRMLRGGSWGGSRGRARASYRNPVSPDRRFLHVGFRLILRRCYEHKK